MSFLDKSSARYILGALGFVAALSAPPWFTLTLLACLTLLYPAWEALFIGLFMDFLWLAPREGTGSLDLFFSLPLFTLAATAMLWGFEPLRREFLLGGRTLL